MRGHMLLFLDDACSWAEKLFTDINLPALMPYEDNNFGGSLVLDFTKWLRHVLPKNFANTMLTIWSYKVLSNVFFYQGSLHHVWELLKMGPAVLSFKCGTSRYKLDSYLHVHTSCILLSSEATSAVLSISLLSSIVDILFLQFIQAPVICSIPLLSSSTMYNE